VWSNPSSKCRSRSKWRLFSRKVSRHIRQVRQLSVKASSLRSKTLTDSPNSECRRSGIRIALTTEAKKSRWACWVTFAKVDTEENGEIIMEYQSVNPANGEVLRSFDQHTDEQMRSALATADNTYRSVWSKMAISDRAKIVGRAASLMLERKETLARIASLEMGKRISEGRSEVELSAAILQYYADNAETFLSPQIIESKIGDARLEYSPFGVLIGVQPWNYPYYQLSRFAAPQLMAGNVLLVKHAPSVPQCALAFEQLLTDAGSPAGAYTNLFLSNDQVGALIDDPRIRGVALTGSERAGESLASRAGKNLKRSTMELGGSDCFIVLEDCDLGYAVKMAVEGRMSNAGQTCIGSKRFIVIGTRAEQFLNAFRDALEQLKPGDPLDEATTLAPVSSDAALNLLLNQVREAVANGARVFTGGDRLGKTGAYMQPTILTNVASDNPAYRQEFFGPVALFFIARDEDEAIAIANDSPFGLGGSVYTSDIEHGKKVASRIETGMVFINYPSMSAPDLPFGGIKRSGYGKELSNLGIEEFVNKKLIWVSPAPPK
jgi:succinate-semialdehyde dehydrogenase/glutarate-semialdehyde dehydrogenase